MAKRSATPSLDSLAVKTLLLVQAGLMLETLASLSDAKVIEPHAKRSAFLGAAKRVSELSRHPELRNEPLAKLLKQYSVILKSFAPARRGGPTPPPPSKKPPPLQW